jgi:hypothetical protein
MRRRRVPYAFCPRSEIVDPHIRKLAAVCPEENLDALVRRARQEALTWLAGNDWAATLAGEAEHQILGQGDGNLANFLWDGDQVRVVDFEDCGPRSRAQDLADFTEHLTVWAHAGVVAEDFLCRFDHSRSERRDVLTLRRVIASVWMMMLLPGGPASHRNPAGTLQRAADRVLGLLGLSPHTAPKSRPISVPLTAASCGA